MGRKQRISKVQRRMLLGLLAAVCLILGASTVGMSVLGQQSEPVRAVSAPDVAAAPEVVEKPPAEKPAAKKEPEKEPVRKEEPRQESRQEARQAPVPEPEPEYAIPADTTMYLTVPKLGLYDIPVVEGTTEASLSAGAGHYIDSGYPWVGGSNTYIAGHRIGYPGTQSDKVFYYLPNLVAGDEVVLTDSLGQTYTYQVTEILEVPITDLSVTAPVAGRDVVSLQTCIEDFGDYWTEGPNWLARYVVRADRVS